MALCTSSLLLVSGETVAGQWRNCRGSVAKLSRVMGKTVAGQWRNRRRSVAKPSQVGKNLLICDVIRAVATIPVAVQSKNTDLGRKMT